MPVEVKSNALKDREKDFRKNLLFILAPFYEL